MAKSKGLPSIFCLVLMVFLQSNSCTSCSGIPSNYNSVVLQASASRIAAGGIVTITASVPRDTTGAGVNWVFTPGAGAPVPPGVFTVNSVTSATYAAPTAAVAAAFTVVIQATSIAFPTETQSITITVEPTAPLAISTTTLPNGVLGAVYPAGTQLLATGGVPPYTWTLTNSTTLPPGLTLATNGDITGTPTSTGIFNTFTVQVADSETTPVIVATTAGQLSITVTNQLSGNYAFEFSGFNSTGPVVVAGSFTADGVSAISGVEDVNSIGAPHANQTFTGTFTLQNNRGHLIFNTLPGTPTYDFALDSTGLHGRMVEFDTTGVRGSGELVQQNTATCGSQTMSGAGPVGADFVIGLSGAEGNFTGTTPGPFVLAGRFTAEVPASPTTPGNIDNGEVDSSSPGISTILPDTTFSGTFQTSSQSARCVMSITQTLGDMNFSVYPITTTGGLLTEAFIVETDTVSQATPFVSVGKLVHQTGYPFSQSIQSFAAASVGGLSGSVIPSGQTAYVPFAAVAQLQANGGSGFTLSLVDNIAGSVDTALGTNAVTASFGTGDSFGRVDTNLIAPGIVPVFYVINANESLCILENLSAPVLGIFEPQSTGPFSTSTITGTLVEGTSQPAATALQNYSGLITLTSGAVAGTEDLSTTVANSTGLTVSGTYALTTTGATDGSGTFNLTQTPPPPLFNGAFFIVSPTKAVMITTTPGDTNPVLTILGEQTDDFGVN
jgi:large repetitive protein